MQKSFFTPNKEFFVCDATCYSIVRVSNIGLGFSGPKTGNQGQGIETWMHKKIMLQGQGFTPWTYQNNCEYDRVQDRSYDHADNGELVCIQKHV